MYQPLRIAVADDEPDVLEHYQKALARLGHRVVVAARDGRELVAGCRAARPDLVITDIRMPDMDGLAAAAAIYREAPVPIILVSAHHTPELIERAEASQVIAYLVKPVRAADLCPAIALAQRRFAQMRAMEGLSVTDELTGLHNRRGFLALAEQQLKLARRQGRKLALLFIDMDGLKRVNDTLGHVARDGVLRATAEVLRRTFRGSDILARLGGDEYCVLVSDAPGGGCAAGVRRLLGNVETYNAGAGDTPVSLSVGAVGVDPGAGLGVEEYLARADERMYEQKRRKRQLKPPHRAFETSPTS
jgi:diguanylate cyclase (GGDEF)-like protein